jgi:hypothetical protein
MLTALTLTCLEWNVNSFLSVDIYKQAEAINGQRCSSLADRYSDSYYLVTLAVRLPTLGQRSRSA